MAQNPNTLLYIGCVYANVSPEYMTGDATLYVVLPRHLLLFATYSATYLVCYLGFQYT
jgi:hypothetical protein